MRCSCSFTEIMSRGAQISRTGEYEFKTLLTTGLGQNLFENKGAVHVDQE